jgi:DNA modification methylase
MTKVRGLNYHWTLCYLQPGNRLAIHSRNVAVHWKPILWFVKGEYKGELRWDIVTSDRRDKKHHQWGKSESAILELVEWFCEPGDLVLDPFCGGGTTGVACLQLGRRFVGVDIDPVAVETTLARLWELH